MEGIPGKAVPRDFAVDFRTARHGVFVLFQNEHTGPFADHKPVAALVKGARCMLRIVVHAA